QQRLYGIPPYYVWAFFLHLQSDPSPAQPGQCDHSSWLTVFQDHSQHPALMASEKTSLPPFLDLDDLNLLLPKKSIAFAPGYWPYFLSNEQMIHHLSTRLICDGIQT